MFLIVLNYALRKAMNGKAEDLGFIVTPRKSSRHPKEVLADLDFVDDISMLSDDIKQAQEPLTNIEIVQECGSGTECS